MCQPSIANIDINKDYDESLGTEDVHYQSFARMAAFFGRDMQAHRHDQYFQMHFLDTGQIELQLDDHRYSVQAPLFVLTPPSVPHAFITESDSDGHVLTVREDLIWPLLEVLYPGTREAFGLPGMCLSLADKPDELTALAHYWQLIKRESTAQLPGIVALIRDAPDGPLVIEGHTDAVGADAANLALSKARAEALRAALVGLEPSLAARLSSQGFGESRPQADNATLEGRARNRRVELALP